MSQNILLVSVLMIKERTAVHGNVDEKLIFPEIKTAQDLFILPILGSALFDKLQTIVNDETITTNPANANYKTLMDRFLTDTLIYYVLSSLPFTSFQFSNKGTVRKQGDNTELPTMGEMVDLSNLYKNRAEAYAERMKLWILANAVIMFPEYLHPGSSIDTVIPSQRAYTTGIYLGDDCGRCIDLGLTRPYHD